MGIKKLFHVIREYAPGAISTVEMNDLKDWRVAVDASISIYQWCAVGQHRKIVNADGKYINHIQGAFYRTLAMLTMDIYPVYVFDGPPPVMKQAVIAARKTNRDNGSAIRVHRSVFAEVEKLLILMGVVIVHAPAEAESQAAALTKNDSVDAVATEDTDAIAFGATYMIRGLDIAAKNIIVVETARVLREMDMTMPQFIDMCILLGCDYTRTIPGIGYKRAVALMRKYKSLEKLFAGEKIKPPVDFDYVAARAEFQRPLVDTTAIASAPRRLTEPDIRQLREFLCAHGLDAKKINNSISKLSKHYGLKIE